MVKSAAELLRLHSKADRTVREKAYTDLESFVVDFIESSNPPTGQNPSQGGPAFDYETFKSQYRARCSNYGKLTLATLADAARDGRILLGSGHHYIRNTENMTDYFVTSIGEAQLPGLDAVNWQYLHSEFSQGFHTRGTDLRHVLALSTADSFPRSNQSARSLKAASSMAAGSKGNGQK